MWFWKRKKSKPKYRYSLNDKDDYYSKLLKNGTSSKKVIAKKNLERLNNFKDMNKSFGKVFITKDKIFFGQAPNSKSRRVIVVGYDKKKDKYKVIPVQKNNIGFINLENFDGNRYVASKSSKWVSSKYLYENRTFSGSNNDKLTDKEKKFIKKYN